MFLAVIVLLMYCTELRGCAGSPQALSIRYRETINGENPRFVELCIVGGVGTEVRSTMFLSVKLYVIYHLDLAHNQMLVYLMSPHMKEK